MQDRREDPECPEEPEPPECPEHPGRRGVHFSDDMRTIREIPCRDSRRKEHRQEHRRSRRRCHSLFRIRAGRKSRALLRCRADSRPLEQRLRKPLRTDSRLKEGRIPTPENRRSEIR